MRNVPAPTRRKWMTTAAAAAAAPRLAAVDVTKPVSGSDYLTAYTADHQVLARWNNLDLLAYRAHIDQKYPYLHPINSLASGLPLTTEGALPYPHQRGAFLGLEPLNGGDYWTDGLLAEGQIQSAGPRIASTASSTAVVTDQCRWVRENKSTPLEDRRSITIRIANDRAYILDVEFHLTAVENIAISSAKHSFFTIRCAPDLAPIYGGALMNSEGGVGASGTYGKPARWCSFFGRRHHAAHVLEGITLMNHPANPWPSCPWFTRDYGCISPSPFNFLKEPWHLAKGEQLRLRYRIVAHAGTPNDADVEQFYREWSA